MIIVRAECALQIYQNAFTYKRIDIFFGNGDALGVRCGMDVLIVHGYTER